MDRSSAAIVPVCPAATNRARNEPVPGPTSTTVSVGFRSTALNVVSSSRSGGTLYSL